MLISNPYLFTYFLLISTMIIHGIYRGLYEHAYQHAFKKGFKVGRENFFRSFKNRGSHFDGEVLSCTKVLSREELTQRNRAIDAITIEKYHIVETLKENIKPFILIQEKNFRNSEKLILRGSIQISRPPATPMHHFVPVS